MADAGAMNQIDTHAPSFDATETRVALVDAGPETVLDAAERVDVARTVVQAIEALGLGDRLALAPARLAAGSREHVYGMAWRVDGGPAETVLPQQLRAFDRRGYVKVFWDVRVEAGSETGSLLSTTTRVVSTDDESRERLEAAWSVFGPVATALATRAITAVKELSEADDELPAVGTLHIPAGHRRASGLAVAA
jgi:hypothetical protein